MEMVSIVIAGPYSNSRSETCKGAVAHDSVIFFGCAKFSLYKGLKKFNLPMHQHAVPMHISSVTMQ